MASKVQVATYSMHDFNEASRWDMEEDDVAGQLKDDSFKKRVEVLEQLIITVKRNGGRLPYADGDSIFRSLGLALSDSNWEIRNKCIQLLQEIIPNLGMDIDNCMCLVLGKLLANIGDSKVTVRRMVVQALHAYMKHTNNLPAVFDAIVKNGLENGNPSVRREMVAALPMLLTQEFVHEDLSGIICSLVKKLPDVSMEDNLKDSSLSTLNKLENMVGYRTFALYLQTLTLPLQKYYHQLSGKQEEEEESSHSLLEADYYTTDHATNSSLQFGFVPTRILIRLNDQKDFKTRAQAVEDLKTIIVNLTQSDLSGFWLHVASFINFLSNLLDDSNFKIVNVTLEIVLVLVEKMDKFTGQFLEQLKLALVKRMGDNKVVIRQLMMSIMMKMMRCTSPQDVISVIEDHLQHRNSRVRQETINFIIAALLTFPRYDFDLPAICKVVGPTLTDVKRTVRQAALECFATLAQVMGSGQLQPLVSAVDQVELCTDGEGLMAAVQARLARKQLPKLTGDGLVEYATHTPASATLRLSTLQPSADTDWIMAVGAATNSSISRSARADGLDQESSIPVAPAPRPFMSAGRGRTKLPWEENTNNLPFSSMPYSSPGQSFHSDEGPPKPREMWTEEHDQRLHQHHHEQHQQTVTEQQRFHASATEDPGEQDDGGGYYSQQYRHRKRSTPRALNSDNVKQNGFSQHNMDAFPTAPAEDKQFMQDKNSDTKRKIESASSKSSSNSEPENDSLASCDGDGRFGMNGSLKAIRNSATKKRADKLFEKLEKQSHQQKSVFAPLNRIQLEDGASLAQADDTFTLKKSETKKSDMHVKRAAPIGAGIIHLDYNPNSGVTFRDNHNSDVQVVGKGYVDDHADVSGKHVLSATMAGGKLKDKKRLTKKGYTEPEVDGTFSRGAETDGRAFPGHDAHMSLVGRGMFEPASESDLGPSWGPNASVPRLTRSKLRHADLKNVPSGVVGVALRSTSDTSMISSDNSDVDDQWDARENLSMTQSFKEKVAAKYQQRQENDERRKTENERKEKEKEQKREQEKEEKLKKERERQQEKLKRLSSSESINNLELSSLASTDLGSDPANGGAEVSTLKNPLMRSVQTSPKLMSAMLTPRRTFKTNSELMSVENTDIENPETWKPFRDGDAALKDFFKKIEQDDWEAKCEGITILRRLSIYHADTVSASLHQIILAVTSEVQNLRSQVSRLAIKAVGEMFSCLKRQMDSEVELTTKILLTKGGESSQFIREDVDTALFCMIDSVTPQKAILGLVGGGANHKNAQIRKLTAQMMAELVEKLGPGRVLSGAKDMTDRTLVTASQFVLDSSQETRYFGRKILNLLLPHQDFELMLAKYVPSNNLRSVMDIVDNLKQKGLGEQPSEISSARSRRSGHGSRSNSAVRDSSAVRTSSAVRDSSASSFTEGARNNPTKHRTLVRTNDSQMEEVQALVAALSANNWQQRYQGVTNFVSMCETKLHLVSTHIIKIFDKFLPRLQDSNSKVNLHALKSMLQVTPVLKEHLSSVISLTVAAVAPNLSSKNKEIYSAAVDILDAFIENLDLALLVQPFASQAMNATPRNKAELVLKVAYVVQKVYHRKQKQVVLHVLPLLWHLLGSINTSSTGVHASNMGVHAGSGDLRGATCVLAGKLHEVMGPSLMVKTSGEPSNTHKQVQLLQNILEDNSS